MTGKLPYYRPWGQLEWALALSPPRRWRFFGCVAPEERSLSALISLHRMNALESIEMLRIIDTDRPDPAEEEAMIRKRLTHCADMECPVQPAETALEAPLQNAVWRRKFSFPEDSSFCLDISSLPKRFFFQAIKAALGSPNVRDFIILYTKPERYSEGSLSSNPKDWATITGFGCEDPDHQSAAASRLIVGAGFAVDGLHDHLEGSSGGITVDVLIPFPADPWKSVRRSWLSAQAIEEALGSDPDKGSPEVKPAWHQVGALDTSTAFQKLLSLTQNGAIPATLAPLGPKPHSAAMCLLAAQSDRHPVYYAQPRAYAVDYSSGCGKTHAFWVKHQGLNLYAI